MLWKQQGPKKPLASFPGRSLSLFPCGPSSHHPYLSPPSLPSSLSRLLPPITSWSLTALRCLHFPSVSHGPSFSFSTWPPSTSPVFPFLFLLDSSSLFSGPSHWSPKVGRVGLVAVPMWPMPHQPRCPVTSGNRAWPAAVSEVPGSGAAAGALASGSSED